MSFQDRYKQVKEHVTAAIAKSRRDPADVTLIAVTKTGTPEQIRQLVEWGQVDLAESRVQQLQQRAAILEPHFPGRVRWHMVGHLQRNKVRSVMHLCHCIHSVDSLRLAEEIQSEAERTKKPMACLMEVNVAEESTKYGVSVGAALHLAEQIDSMDEVQLIGLMCMAPYSTDPERARPCFVRLREIFEEIRFRKFGGDKFRHLSMGMSGDYRVAIEEGATMVRVGSAIFG